MRGAALCLPFLLLALAGCATQPVVIEKDADSYNIGQQLLPPLPNGGQVGQVQPYALSGSDVFRMPESLHAPLPELPAAASGQTLPPVTVCLNVVVDAQGQVPRSFPLSRRSECAASDDVQNAVLLGAAADAVQRWRFRPAAICRFAPGVRPAAESDCTGAETVEDVPVTLAYAFTFEIVQGQARVRIGKTPR